MTGIEPRVQRIRTGGRSAVVRDAVTDAVLSLLREGRADFSVADVAQRAGVHRSTVYRWWPTRVELIKEVLTEHTANLTTPDTGSWPDDARALARTLADFFADPVERTLNTILTADADPEVTTIQFTHWRPIMDQLTEVVARARAAGDLRADADPRLILQMIVGPLLLHASFARTPASAATVDDLAAAVVRAFAAEPT